MWSITELMWPASCKSPPIDAREQLRGAHESFVSMGADALPNGLAMSFSPRARRCAAAETTRATSSPHIIKLGISSRRQLRSTLPDTGRAAVPV
jgi:hypothetical protein